MKNKKVVLYGLVFIIILAISCGIFIATHNPNYLYNQDGTIVDGHKDLINKLKSIENPDEKKKQIDFSFASNLITKQEANELY